MHETRAVEVMGLGKGSPFLGLGMLQVSPVPQGQDIAGSLEHPPMLLGRTSQNGVRLLKAEPREHRRCLPQPQAERSGTAVGGGRRDVENVPFCKSRGRFPRWGQLEQRQPRRTQRQRQTLPQPLSPVLSRSIIATEGSGLISPRRHLMKLLSLMGSCALEQ